MSFQPGQVVIRDLPHSRNKPRWGVYIRDAKRYDDFGYVLLWSRTTNGFNESLSPCNHKGLIPLDQATHVRLKVLPNDVYDVARRTLEKQHPRLAKEIYQKEPQMDPKEYNELEDALVKSFQEARQSLAFFRVLTMNGHTELAKQLANGEVSYERAVLYHKRTEATILFDEAREQLSEAAHKLRDIKDKIYDLDVAEGRIQPAPPRKERAHDMVRVDIIDLPKENQNGIIVGRKQANYFCKCGFEGTATSGFSGEDVGRKAWKNFRAHQHRMTVREMKAEKAHGDNSGN